MTQRVINAGYGPVGRTLADALAERGLHLTIIDANPDTIRTQTSLGREAIHGDVADPRILEEAGVHDATALVVAIPDADKAIEACSVARSLVPDLFIAVRTGFLSEGIRAMQTGADSVTIEEIATAESLASSVLGHLSPPHEVCEGAD